MICEKPSVAADVAKALSSTNRFQKTEWGYASTQVLVAAAAGHLVSELPPEQYDARWKEWSYASLPIIPEQFKYQPRDQRGAQRLKQLSDLIRRDDVTEIVNACDAGREGELIFKLILQFANGMHKTVKRAWFSSMTPQAILDAFSDLRDDNDMKGLEAAARCRSEADWLVGLNATRAASCTLGGGRLLSLGRVQTPTLSLVVRRDVEIEEFVSVPFFQVEATFQAAGGSYTGMWRSGKDTDATDRFDTSDAASDIVQRVKLVGKGVVETVEVKMEEVAPPRLFDLTDLQREANRRFGMTATKTLVAAQACYEIHKVLSYPRTDSRYLPSDMASAVAGLVARVQAADPEYIAAATAVLANCDPTRLINDSKVTDHHALVPTDAAHDLSVLSVDERRIYDLVARRLLAALLPPQKLERTTIWTRVDTTSAPELFRSSGRRDIEPGWRIAWPEAAEKKKGAVDDGEGDESEHAVENTQKLPEIVEDEQVVVRSSNVKEGHTQPPARFTEASILGVMASAGRLVEDDELADAMKDRGLGTPATRASILERLVDVEYLLRQGRQLRATDKGRGVILALGDHPLVKPELTGGWEQRLRELERTNAKEVDAFRNTFTADVREFAREIVAGFADATPERLLAGRRKLADCPMPECEGRVVDGKRGWGCSSYKSKDDTGCGFVIWKEQAGKKLTEKQLLTRIDDIKTGKTPPPAKPGERIVIGTCPSDGCGADIVERQKSWGCSSWKSPTDTGCGFVIWKSDPDGTTIDETKARGMLALGISNAKPKPQMFAKCPRCSGDIVDRGKFLGCNSWQTPKKTGCGTTLWKVQAGKELEDEELRSQLDSLQGTIAPKQSPKKAGSKPSNQRR